MKSLTKLAAIAVVSLGLASPALAAENNELPKQNWSFDGIFGAFDKAELQRGFQVYAQVCASCHSLSYVSYRNLLDLGYSQEEVKAFAAEYEVEDGPDDDGEMYTRPAQPSDRFVSPFANPQAARASNGGALPPDLSLMAKAREGGPDYIYALMTGFQDEAPDGAPLPDGMYYNAYFPSHKIAMAPPLGEDAVEYASGLAATTEQMAKDVTAFLMWTAEPKLDERHSTGLAVLIFLAVFTALSYAVKRKVWAKLH
jgi:cytochrome c1|tara:strand:+ start:1869 stop:2633 length:765 start_codon:yes stop_codon:yes gene_type:complete